MKLQRKINKIIQSSGEEDTEVWKRVHCHICWKPARAGGVAQFMVESFKNRFH